VQIRLHKFPFFLTGLEETKIKILNENCQNAKNIYDINGLLDEVPPEWNCNQFYRRDPSVLKIRDELQNQQLEDINYEKGVINILMVGKTGVGKVGEKIIYILSL
jgi:hypothetical protein